MTMDSYEFTLDAVYDNGYVAGYKSQLSKRDSIARIRAHAVRRNDEHALTRCDSWLEGFTVGWDLRRAEEAASAHAVPVTLCDCGVPDCEHVAGGGCQPDWGEAA